MALNTHALAFRKLPFWKRVELQTERLPWSGCHIFTGGTVGNGYGIAHDNKKHRLIHRASYEKNVGQIPEGMFVLHRCDVPSCFNPEHLFLGTLADNNRDRERKGHGGQPKGAKHPRPMAKLSESDVREIRAALLNYHHGMCSVLARKYRISVAVISGIRWGRNWKHVS